MDETLSEKELELYGFLSYIKTKEGLAPSELLLPIVKHCICTIQKKHFTTEEICREIKSHFGKEFITIVVQRLLLKLSQNGYIKQYSKQINKWELIKELETYESIITKSKASLEKFYKSFNDYIHKKHPTFQASHSTIVKRIKVYCEEYYKEIIPLLLVNNASFSNLENKKSNEKIHSLFTEYLMETVFVQDELKNIFTNIFNGSMILVLFERIGEQFEDIKTFILPKTIYIDTNVLLRILNLQDTFLNQLGKEFFNLISKFGIEIRIWDKTLFELESLIRGYQYAEKYLLLNGNVSHLYQNMKNMHIDVNDISEFIITQKNRIINDYSIKIDKRSSLREENAVLLENLIPKLTQLKIEKKNDIPDQYVHPSKYDALSRHDISALLLVEELRKENIVGNNNFSDTEYFFISSDTTTLKFQRDMEKEAYSGMPIGISDSALSFILYFCLDDVAKNIAVNSFMLAHFNTNNLSLNNWVDYVNESKKQVIEGKINRKTLGYLITKVSLKDSIFQLKSIEDIVNSAIEEYGNTEKQYSEIIGNQQSENKNLNKKVIDLENQMNILLNSKSDDDFEKQKLEMDILDIRNNLQKSNENFYQLKILLYFLLSIIILIGIYLLFQDKPFVGSLTTMIGVFLSILNYFDKLLDIIKKIGEMKTKK